MTTKNVKGNIMIVLYARKAPTKDPIFKEWLLKNLSTRYQAALGIAPYYDVEIAKDEEFKNIKCVYRWDKESKPDHRFKYIKLNCFKYKLEWVK